MLLRTILTLISRTPEEYLHELIVIDDGSEDGEPDADIFSLIYSTPSARHSQSACWRVSNGT